MFKRFLGALTVLILAGLLVGCGRDNRDMNHFLNAFTAAGYTIEHNPRLSDLSSSLVGIIDQATIWVGSANISASRDFISIFEFEDVSYVDGYLDAIIAVTVTTNPDLLLGRNGRFLIMTESRTMMTFFENIR